MHLIDGNNLAGHLWNDPLRRKETIDFVMNAYRGRKKQAILFFDGPEDAAVPRRETYLGNVRVILSPSGGADSRILGLARRHPGAVVVTADQALAGMCKKAGAHILSPGDFIRKAAS